MTIAVISDIHGNLPALKAVIKQIKKLDCKTIISLGDVTGYYSQPNACIDLLRSEEAIQLLGNHDNFVINEDARPSSKVISALLNHQLVDISKENKDYLSTLKSIYNYKNMSFVHGGWNDHLNEYLYEINDEKLLGNYKFYFSGHTHVQVNIELCKKNYCNPGSVGQPRDGNPEAAFATISSDKVRLYRVAYDVDDTITAMIKAGFNNSDYYSNLHYGTQIGGKVFSVVTV